MVSRKAIAVGMILMLAAAATLLMCLSESGPITPISDERAEVSVGARQTESMKIDPMTVGLTTNAPQRVPIPEPTRPDVPPGYEAKDVRDLLPRMRAGTEDAQSPFSAMDLLVANLREATGSSYWDSSGGHILPSSTGYVLVHANRDTHRRVDTFLQDLRRFVLSSSGPRRR